MTTADGDLDDALSWGEEKDASHVEGPAPVGRAVQDDEPEDDVDDGPTVMSSTSLVAHGVLGGVFLLWAAGWIVAVGGFTNPFTDAVSSVMWNLGELFAVTAPLFWFVAVIAFVPLAKSRRRIGLMVLGALVVAPWPLVIGGAS